jgi:hypothetical protein
MVGMGQKAVRTYLQNPLGLDSLPQAAFGEKPAEKPPAGAQVYTPFYISPCNWLDLPPPERQITTYLARHGPVDALTLGQDLGRSPAQVRIILASLIKKGHVQNLPDGKVKVVVDTAVVSRCRSISGRLCQPTRDRELFRGPKPVFRSCSLSHRSIPCGWSTRLRVKSGL